MDNEQLLCCPRLIVDARGVAHKDSLSAIDWELSLVDGSQLLSKKSELQVRLTIVIEQEEGDGDGDSDGENIGETAAKND